MTAWESVGWFLMRVVEGNENLHTLWMSDYPLGVYCAHCGHRSVLSQEKAGAMRADMTELRTLKFRCESCKRRYGTAVGGDVVLYLFSSNDEVDQFAGTTVDEF